MNKILVIIAAAFILGGCATLQQEGSGIVHNYKLSRNLAEARTELEKGHADRAATLLEEIVLAKGVPEVTDEALFRLALLSLNSAVEKSGTSHSLQTLKRLQKEYPASPWAIQAAPLTEFLNRVEELKRQNRNYRSLNQSLGRDNKELIENIEKLKHLDMELEKKVR
jgi:hypothetical protein